MRFNILCGAFGLMFIAVVFLSWVIARDLTSEDNSPVRGVNHVGQILNLGLDPSCAEYNRVGGMVEIVCPYPNETEIDGRLVITEGTEGP